MKLLIVEDDKQLSESIVRYLRQNNFLCDIALDYHQAEDKLLDTDYDCVVLDITLPGGNGLQLLKRLKALDKSDGVIIISAKHAVADRINGLGSGADDYLTKPFHLAELSARIDAIIRRRFFNGKHVITIKHLSVNITDKNVKIGADYIELTRKEYELLLYFISNQNKVITKEAIIEHLWGYDVGLSNNYDFLYAHIKNLRKKMFFDGCSDFIQVVYGLGYKFVTSLSILKMKLIVKYNRAFFPVIVILLLLFGLVSYLFTKQVLQDEVDESLVRTQHRLTQFMDTHQELPSAVSFDDLRVTIEPTNVSMPARQIISTTLSIPGRAKNHPARVLIFTVNHKGILHKISVLSPLEGVKTLTKTLLLIYLISFFLAFLILIFMSRRILKRIWAPFYNSLKLVKEFKIDDNSVMMFPVTEIEEFKEMNHNFESATTSAQNDYKRLKEFTENASHEIQTPLAVIRSKLNLLAQEDHLKESASLLLEDAFDAVTKLTNLNQSLLLLAKIENNQFLNKTKVNLSETLETIIHRYQELWQNSNIGLMSQIDPVFVHAHNDLMDILLNNLISNATRHNIVGGQISIRLESGRLTILNTGRHKALDSDKLFGRFYKESDNSNHNGLGLAIVKEICMVSSFSIVYQYHGGNHTFCVEWK